MEENILATANFLPIITQSQYNKIVQERDSLKDMLYRVLKHTHESGYTDDIYDVKDAGEWYTKIKEEIETSRKEKRKKLIEAMSPEDRDILGV